MDWNEIYTSIFELDGYIFPVFAIMQHIPS